MQDQVRATIGVIVGITAAVFMIMCADAVFNLLHPFPETLDYNDREQMNGYMQTVPTGIFVVHVLCYALAAFVGGWVTNKIAQGTRYQPALITGIGFLVLCIFNMVMLWHPVWVWVLSIPLYLVAAWYGGKFSKG